MRAIYDLKALIEMKKARITAILPGIESFSTDLLKLMNKGTTGWQNLLLLRNTRSVSIYTDWFLIWGFPGDKITDYKVLLDIIPLIRHLQPPKEFYCLQLMSSSRYVADKDSYNITNIQPWEVYNMIYPDWAERNKLVLYNSGEYQSESFDHPEIIKEIVNELSIWRKRWKSTKVEMTSFMGGYVIYDNRDFNRNEKRYFLDFDKAKEIMTARIYRPSEDFMWALEEKLAVVLDAWYVPLVTASTELLLEFEQNKSIRRSPDEEI